MLKGSCALHKDKPKRGNVISRLLIVLLILALIAGLSHASDLPEASIPTSDDVVLERLPPSYSQIRVVQAQLRSAKQVEELIEAGAASGDARILGMAEAAISQGGSAWNVAELALARSWLMQHRHDFSGALKVLNGLLSQQAHSGALSARAQILLVQGELQATQQDCSSLLLKDQSQAMLCAAYLAARRGNLNGASLLLERWLTTSSSTSTLRRSVLVRTAEVACAQRDFAACELRFEQALMLNPADVRTVAARTRALRAQGRFPEVLALLELTPASDTLLLERLLAAHALDAAEAPTLRDQLSARYALMRARGEVPELREEAEFELTILLNTQRSLALAKENFAVQRDVEDVELLIRAAAAAASPQTQSMVSDWQREQGIDAALEQAR